jgi:putative Mg2+ transporter-C (MgtC) family protein
MTLLNFLPQLLLALALGSLIGLERQWHRRLVDLKTNSLVCMGAALFMSVSYTGGAYVEPIRMAAQIVVGVGFIGGGLLLRDGNKIIGINTAATLWCCAAIGTLCGLGRMLEASVATVLLVGANTVLRALAHALQMRMGLSDSLTEQLSFELECPPEQAAQVRAALETVLRQAGGELRAVREVRNPQGNTLLSMQAAFESADIHADIRAVEAAADGWNILSLSWHRL